MQKPYVFPIEWIWAIRALRPLSVHSDIGLPSPRGAVIKCIATPPGVGGGVRCARGFGQKGPALGEGGKKKEKLSGRLRKG